MTVKRANGNDTTKPFKRATDCKTTIAPKCAVEPKTTKARERARNWETTAPLKRPDVANLRTFVRGAYDIQKLRIQMSNRIVSNFKAQLGQEHDKTEAETLDAEGKAILANLRAHYKKLIDGVVTFPKQSQFKGDEVISDYTVFCLLAQYADMEKYENQHFRRLGNILKEFPIFVEFLDGVKGIGPAMGGVIVSEIDIHKARYPSSLWAYAGLDVASDGRGRSKQEQHLVEVEYTDKDGKPATRRGITFNPFLKTKLIGVLGTSFLRTVEWDDMDRGTWDTTFKSQRRIKEKNGEEHYQIIIEQSPYRVIYYNYKYRLEHHFKYGVKNDGIKDENDHVITSKGRRHNMAIRYMIKMFLIDLYKAWRELEGLEVSPPYHEAKLGLKHVV